MRPPWPGSHPSDSLSKSSSVGRERAPSTAERHGSIASPAELTLCLSRLRRDVPELEGAVLSFHGHDDLGIATANAIAAVSSGARQLEVAVNGVGDVRGNTSLQEVLGFLRVRGDRWGVETTLESQGLRALSELVDARRQARLRERSS